MDVQLYMFINGAWQEYNPKPAAHDHTISEVTGLQTQLNSKLNLSGGTMTGPITMGSNNITGNNSSIFQAGRIIATNSNTNDHGITSKGSRANMLYLMDGATGGLAASLLDVDVKNTTTPQKRIAKIGIFGSATSGTGGTPSANYLWLSAVDGNTYNVDATLKVDAQNRIGIAITGSGRPTQALDVGGKIRMRTATVDSDDADTVVTKGYMLGKIVSDTNNYLTTVTGSGNETVTFTRQGLLPLTWDATHSHGKAQITNFDNEVLALFPAWAKASTKPGYNLGEIDDTLTYKKVSQAEKNVWNGKQGALGFTPENPINKRTSIRSSGATDTAYVSELGVKTYVDGKVVQADWNETNSSSDAFIKNKPELNYSKWTQVWSGAVNLNSYTNGYYQVAVPSNSYIGKRIAIEVQYGSGTIYTSKIIFGVLGNSSTTTASTTISRGIGWNYFDGTYFRVKTLFAYTPTGLTTSIYVGNLKTLFGTFTGTTIEWSTSYSETLYMKKIWVIE